VSTTVLLVDDTALMRDLARAELELAGWTVAAEAVNGFEAIHKAYQFAPDVIVLDRQMPVLDGLTALPKIRRASPCSRIVMWSHDVQVSRTALDLGASAFVDKAKPLDHLLIAVALMAPIREAVPTA
jgi:chemotaxis response regulator CheB